MKYIFRNRVTGEKLIRELPQHTELEENWVWNVIDSWAMMTVRARWLNEGKLNRFVDFFELVTMDDEKKAAFYWELKNEKRNLEFEMLEESFEGEEDDCKISVEDALKSENEVENIKRR